jgi:hypothetical protein
VAPGAFKIANRCAAKVMHELSGGPRLAVRHAPAFARFDLDSCLIVGIRPSGHSVGYVLEPAADGPPAVLTFRVGPSPLDPELVLAEAGRDFAMRLAALLSFGSCADVERDRANGPDGHGFTSRPALIARRRRYGRGAPRLSMRIYF